MFYGNRFIRVHRERENKMINFETGTPFETVTLTTLGTSRQLFIDMLQEAREFGLRDSEGACVRSCVFMSDDVCAYACVRKNEGKNERILGILGIIQAIQKKEKRKRKKM